MALSNKLMLYPITYVQSTYSWFSLKDLVSFEWNQLDGPKLSPRTDGDAFDFEY